MTLQKDHTSAIEEIIADTKSRLDKMEEKARHQNETAVFT